jgi:hypothetical protein
MPASRYRLLRETKTRAGYRRDDVRNPLTGSDRYIAYGHSDQEVIARARVLGVCGLLIAVEVDENDRPLTRAEMEMN